MSHTIGFSLLNKVLRYCCNNIYVTWLYEACIVVTWFVSHVSLSLSHSLYLSWCDLLYGHVETWVVARLAQTWVGAKGREVS